MINVVEIIKMFARKLSISGYSLLTTPAIIIQEAPSGVLAYVRA
jgi:hypothetical protein